MSTDSKIDAKPKNRSTTAKPGSKGAGQTKMGMIRKLLMRPNGASIGQLQKATGWQPHSVRAALSGIRKQGTPIERSSNPNGRPVYRLTVGS